MTQRSLAAGGQWRVGEAGKLQRLLREPNAGVGIDAAPYGVDDIVADARNKP